MNKRSRTTKPQLAKPTFSGSREASPLPAGDRKGKDEGKRQQRSGGAASSASSGDEISASRSVSSGEEATGRTRRPRRKERRRWDAVPLRYVVPREESSAPGSFINLTPAVKKSSRGKSTQKEKSSTSYFTWKKNAREEESLSSHPARNITMNPRGKVYVEAVDISSWIAQSPNQEQQEHSEGSSDQAASNLEGDAQVVTEASAAPPSEVVSDSSIYVTADVVKEDCLDDAKLLSRSRSVEAPEQISFVSDSSIHVTGDIVKEDCLDDAKLLSRNRSVEAQEPAFFDVEASTLLRVEDKKPKPKHSSVELGSIALVGDDYSGKKTAYGDLRKIITSDEDEQHPDKSGVPAIEALKQGKEGAGWRALLDMDIEEVSEKISHYFAKLRSEHPDDDCTYLPPYEPHQLTEVYEQLALYRIRGYQLSVDQQLAELDDENLRKHYSSADLFDEGYFEYYEESLEWYFDPELCKCPGYDDYQRLVLYNHGEYVDWDNYHSTLNTYEKDLAYVQYCEALVNETKWIVEDYLAQSTHQWKRVRSVAYLQALQIATPFTNVSPRLVLFAFDEYIWSILFDHSNYKDMDGLYFEIWKRVAKLKKDFREALLEIHRENMFPMRAVEIEHELEDKQARVFYMKNDYDAYVAGIDEMASDDKALQDIREAVKKMIPKQMIYLDYIQKKVDIAKDIGLIRKAPRQLDDSQGTYPEGTQ